MSPRVLQVGWITTRGILARTFPLLNRATEAMRERKPPFGQGNDAMGSITRLTQSLLQKYTFGQMLLQTLLLLFLLLLLFRGGEQSSNHLLPSQGFPLALLRHLEPKLINHSIMARSDVSVTNHSATGANLVAVSGRFSTHREKSSPPPPFTRFYRS